MKSLVTRLTLKKKVKAMLNRWQVEQEGKKVVSLVIFPMNCNHNTLKQMLTLSTVYGNGQIFFVRKHGGLVYSAFSLQVNFLPKFH